MSITDRESSLDNATPFEVITITGGSTRFRYTTYNTNLTDSEGTIKAVPIKHDNAQSQVQDKTAKMNVSIPWYEDIGAFFIDVTPQTVCTLKIQYFDMWIDNPDSWTYTANDYIITWEGYLMGIEIQWPWIEFQSSDLFISGDRLALRRHYSRQCPHTLYDRNCKVSSLNFMYVRNLISFTTKSFTLDAPITDNILAGGYCVYRSLRTNSDIQALVTGNTGTLVNIAGRAAYPHFDIPIRFYCGCAKTIEECMAKFDNKANFGGFPFVPAQNIFGGANLYY